MGSSQGLDIEFNCWRKVWRVGVVEEGVDVVCKVVAIALLVMTLLVMYVITVQSYFVISVV